MNSIFESVKVSEKNHEKMKPIEISLYLLPQSKDYRFRHHKTILQGADAMLSKIIMSYNGISVAFYMILISIRR